MIQFETTELQTNESLKTFESPDALAKSYLELQGKVSSGDISILPEDVRKDPSVAKYKNVVELAKGHSEAAKLIGTIKHAPEKPEDYKFTQLQNLHPGIAKGSPETQKFLATLFKSLDLDNDRADKGQQAIITALNTSMVRQDEARVAKGKEVETALRSKWGAEYDKNKANVENVLKRSGLESLVDVVGGDPDKLEKFHKITSMLSEDSIGKLGEGTNTSIDSKTKEGALKRIGEINEEVRLQKATHPLFDSKSAKHEEMKKEWSNLHEVAYG
jgi:hypothetical protein